MKSFHEVLAPGVILVDGADVAHFDPALYQVAGHGDIIHRAMGGGAEDVFELVLLEDAGCTAVEENQKPLEFLGRRRNGEAVAGADIAQDRVDMIALEGVTQFLDLFGGAASLVDELNFELQAAEADLVVGLGQAPGIERIDDRLGALHGRLAERFGRRPGEKGDKSQFEYVVVLSRGTGRECAKDAGAGDQGSCKSTKFHGSASQLKFLLLRRVHAARPLADECARCGRNCPRHAGPRHAARHSDRCLRE